MFLGGVVSGQVSIEELERRWAAVRKAMDHQDIDVLLGYSASDTLGGHIRYLVDLPSAGSYPTTLIFPREDDMTLVLHGSFKGDQSIEPQREGALRGIKRMLTTPAFIDVHYTKEYEAERAERRAGRLFESQSGIAQPATNSLPDDGLSSSR